MAKNYYKFIIDNTKDYITLINKDYTYVFVNDKYCDAFNTCKDDLIGVQVQDVWGEERFYKTIKGYLDRCFGGEEIHYIDEFTFGPILKYMQVSYTPYSENGEVTHAAVFSRDITHIGRLESKLNFYEYRDPLTGLFNRRSLDVILEKELEKALFLDSKKPLIVFILELDKMEKVIEMFGQDIYDLLLENTGIRIKNELRTNDYVFRLEGYKFAVILSEAKDKLDAGRVAAKIHDVVSLPYNFKGNDMGVDCYVGAAAYPIDGTSGQELIRKATSAMLESKRSKQNFVIYNKKTHSIAVRRLNLESSAYRALERQQFEIHYQPIVDENFHIAGAEALLRWNHPGLGFIGPDDFIPILEQSNLIFPVGKWVLYSVCHRLKTWGSRYGIFVSINLSGKEISSPHIVSNIKSIMDNGKELDPKYLKIEITETACVSSIEGAGGHIQELNRLGVEVLIDDFGTGNSSLQYLQDLPADILKIDRCFVNNIENDKDQLDFLNHIVHMIKSRHKNILIEGVETAEQASLLKDMGCAFLQGFYFSKPVTEENFDKLLQRGTSLPAESTNEGV